MCINAYSLVKRVYVEYSSYSLSTLNVVGSKNPREVLHHHCVVKDRIEKFDGCLACGIVAAGPCGHQVADAYQNIFANLKKRSLLEIFFVQCRFGRNTNLYKTDRVTHGSRPHGSTGTS